MLAGNMSPKHGMSAIVHDVAPTGRTASRPILWPLATDGPQKSARSISRRRNWVNDRKLVTPLAIAPCSLCVVIDSLVSVWPQCWARASTNAPTFQSSSQPCLDVGGWSQYVSHMQFVCDDYVPLALVAVCEDAQKRRVC